MKTTIDIADPILARAKHLAAKHHTTLRAIVEEALRARLALERRPHPRVRLETHTFAGNGLQEGLSWDDWTTMRSMGYEGRGG